jgi:hypothetical protein
VSPAGVGVYDFHFGKFGMPNWYEKQSNLTSEGIVHSRLTHPSGDGYEGELHRHLRANGELNPHRIARLVVGRNPVTYTRRLNTYQ